MLSRTLPPAAKKLTHAARRHLSQGLNAAAIAANIRNPPLNFDDYPDIRKIKVPPNAAAIERITKRQQYTDRIIGLKYPHLSKPWPFYNAIAYRFDRRSPEEIIAQGGFSNDKPVFFAKDSADGGSYNTGVVNFSLIPGVTVLFLDDQKQATAGYLYATPMLDTDKTYLAPGPWRQPFIGTLPLTYNRWFLARKIVDANPRILTLASDILSYGISPAEFQMQYNNNHFLGDEALQAFFEGRIITPQESYASTAEHPANYNIVDTTLSLKLVTLPRTYSNRNNNTLEL